VTLVADLQYHSKSAGYHVEDLKAPDHFQIELVELSEDNIIKSLFDTRRHRFEVLFSKMLFSCLGQYTPEMLCWFGSTYRCDFPSNTLPAEYLRITLKTRFVLMKVNANLSVKSIRTSQFH